MTFRKTRQKVAGRAFRLITQSGALSGHFSEIEPEVSFWLNFPY